MALLPDRLIEMSFGDKILNDVAAKGVFLCYSTAGSGAGMGSAAGYVQLAAAPSGLKVAGGLLQDFVDIDETLQHRNFHKEQMVIGDFADVARRGYFTTDKISGTPAVGDKAYLTTNGNVTPTVSATGGVVATPLVGEFGTTKDSNGFARVNFNLPTALS